MVITGRDLTRLQEVKELCEEKGNSQIEIYQGDLTSQDICRQLITFVEKKFRRIDFLVLNAGINAHF